MSATLSPDLRNLPDIIGESFKRSLIDEVAPAYAREWKGQIQELDVIDTGNYLESIEVGDEQQSGDVFSVTIDAERASGYAAAIKRGHGGNYDYVGVRVAEQAIERAEGEVNAALDKAGKRVE